MKKVKPRGSRHVIDKIKREQERLREQRQRQEERRVKDLERKAQRAEQGPCNGVLPSRALVTLALTAAVARSL